MSQGRAHPSQPRTVITVSAIVLCISNDEGTTWSVEQEGLHATYSFALALSDDYISVAASEEHFEVQDAF